MWRCSSAAAPTTSVALTDAVRIIFVAISKTSPAWARICVKMLVFAGQGSVGYLLRCGLVRPAQFPIRKVGSTTGGNIGRAAMERGCKKETSRSGTGAAWTQAVYLRITRRRGPWARCDVCIRWLGDTALALLGPGFGFRGGSRGLLASSLSELNANPLILLILAKSKKPIKSIIYGLTPTGC